MDADYPANGVNFARRNTAQAAFVAEAVMFEGEKLTITDLAELVPAGDVLQLIGEVFGKDGGTDADGGDEGNGVTAH